MTPLHPNFSPLGEYPQGEGVKHVKEPRNDKTQKTEQTEQTEKSFMYKELLTVSPETLADQGVRPISDYYFAANQMVMELVHSELTSAIAAMPLAFNHSPRSGQTHLVALLSLTSGSNNFVTPDGRWCAAYKPELLRGYPFAMGNLPDQPDQPLLCIDSTCLTSANEDHPALFTANDTPSAALQEQIEFWQAHAAARSLTRRLASELNAAGLLHPWNLTVLVDEQETRFEGLLKVDEDALHNLEPQRLSELAKSGALVLAYGQMLSLGRMDVLRSAGNLRVDHLKKRREFDEQLRAALASGATELSFDF